MIKRKDRPLPFARLRPRADAFERVRAYALCWVACRCRDRYQSSRRPSFRLRPRKSRLHRRSRCPGRLHQLLNAFLAGPFLLELLSTPAPRTS